MYVSLGIDFRCLNLTLPCRSDEYIPNTLVLLDYYPLTAGSEWSLEVLHLNLAIQQLVFYTDIQVSESTTSAVLFSKKQISSSGRFSFVTSSKGGDYIFCFQNLHSTELHRMSMTLKHGVDATDYHDLMKSKHFTELETDFTRMIDQVATLKKDLDYFKNREIASRNTSESNCERTLVFCIFGIIVTCLSGFIFYRETKKELVRHKLC